MGQIIVSISREPAVQSISTNLSFVQIVLYCFFNQTFVSLFAAGKGTEVPEELWHHPRRHKSRKHHDGRPPQQPEGEDHRLWTGQARERDEERRLYADSMVKVRRNTSVSRTREEALDLSVF